jgi:hypothetical protein
MTPETKLDEKARGSDPDRSSDHGAAADAHVPAGRWARLRDLLHRVAVFGRVEVRGITPIPVKERTVDRTVNIFTLWWSMNTNILG